MDDESKAILPMGVRYDLSFDGNVFEIYSLKAGVCRLVINGLEILKDFSSCGHASKWIGSDLDDTVSQDVRRSLSGPAIAKASALVNWNSGDIDPGVDKE